MTATPTITTQQGCAVCSKCHRKFEPCCCGIDKGSEHCWWCGAVGKPTHERPPILASDDHPTGANRAAIAQSYISNECLAGHHDRCEDPVDCSCPCHEDDE